MRQDKPTSMKRGPFVIKLAGALGIPSAVAACADGDAAKKTREETREEETRVERASRSQDDVVRDIPLMNPGVFNAYMEFALKQWSEQNSALGADPRSQLSGAELYIARDILRPYSVYKSSSRAEPESRKAYGDFVTALRSLKDTLADRARFPSLTKRSEGNVLGYLLYLGYQNQDTQLVREVFENSPGAPRVRFVNREITDKHPARPITLYALLKAGTSLPPAFNHSMIAPWPPHALAQLPTSIRHQSSSVIGK